MEWSPQQTSAMELVADWVRHTQQHRAGYPDPANQVFRLFGYAGTGKTTLARTIAEQQDGRVLFAAYTGKAALVLRKNGCPGASTIHKLIYVPKDKSGARLRELKLKMVRAMGSGASDADLARIAVEVSAEEKRLKQPAFDLNSESEITEAGLVIVDEVSMVGVRVAEDLLSFDVPILVLGDPAQLPPIGDGGYFTSREPDVMLTEIHRQAAKSPIIDLATRVRLGKGLPMGEFGTSAVVPRGRLTLEDLYEHDMILCGMNRTRRILNRRIREEILGRESHLPEPGDRLVCLRNNHELGLLNGSLWSVVACDIIDEDHLAVVLTGEDGAEVATEAYRHHFEEREVGHFERGKADEFDFGYALTCHKAQGSQWGSVVIIDESRVFRAHQRNWLYTAITRAADVVTVIVS